MECIFARFRYGPTIQTVALYPGIPCEELSVILSTILPVVGKIVGLQDENGAVIPLSLACRSPTILSGALYVILVADTSSSVVDSKPETIPPSAPPLTDVEVNEVEDEAAQISNDSSLGAPAPPLQPSVDPEFDNVLSADDDAQLADNTLDELLRFIAGLRVKRIIKKQESDALEELLFNNSSLIFAAYSVAKSAGDAQYLTEVCKDIAQSMMTTAGQSACAAQEDVLQCCDQLYINSKITENQLLYLRHLVLIRDEDVAQMYDDFQDGFDLERLMIGLFRLANSQPKMKEEVTQSIEKETSSARPEKTQSIQRQQQEITNSYKQQQKQKLTIQTPAETQTKRSQSNKESSKSRSKKENPYRKKTKTERTSEQSTKDIESKEQSAVQRRSTKDEQSIMFNTLNGIIALMIRTGDITSVEAVILNHLITSENEYVLAAYEIFQSDGNVVELQDTLMRIAKVELKRRGLDKEQEQKKKIASSPKKNQTVPSPQRRQQQVAQNRDVSEADDEDSPTSSDDNSQPVNRRSNPRDLIVDDSPVEQPQSSDSPSQLTRLLSSLNVTNQWKDTVPTKFIFTVFSAAQQRLLSTGQGRALCDLYQAQYDLVRAAWEVYNVQNDIFDFIDTLKRIVRDLTFQENGNVNLSASPEEEENYEPSETQSEDESKSSSKNILQVMKETEDRAKEARDAKSNALAAVAEAKKELLKHSLEIMVKQGLVTTQAASNLYERALKGDPLTDAAIEGYAGDRNIMEFLDTLQILANNTPEDLEKMLRSAMEEPQDEENEEEPEEVEEEVEEESDEIDPEDEDLDEVQLELKAVAKELFRQGDLDETNYSSLLKMIRSNDDRVLAAHDVYRDLQDKDDLADSLIRISRKHFLERQSSDAGIEMSELSKPREPEPNEVEMTRLSQHRPKNRADESGVELSTIGKSQGASVPPRPQSPPGLLNADDQKSILVILTNSGVLTDDQANQVITLIDNGSHEIQLIFKQYERNKDVYTLIESLRLASSEAEEVEDEDISPSEENDIDSTERVGEIDPEDDDDDESGLDEDEKESIEMKFLNIIQGMNLSHLETAALRLAIARDDPAIRNALETFRIDRNETLLMDTLRDVARETINETLNEAGYDGVEEDPQEVDEDSQVDQEEDDYEDDQPEGQQNESEEDVEEDDDQDEDGEDDDSQSNDLILSKSARQHIFPILMNELVKESVLTQTESKKLLELFHEDDDVIHAALDVYDLDSDLSELVDTLQRIVKTSNE